MRTCKHKCTSTVQNAAWGPHHKAFWYCKHQKTWPGTLKFFSIKYTWSPGNSSKFWMPTPDF
jgi:hypothetical protein